LDQHRYDIYLSGQLAEGITAAAAAAALAQLFRSTPAAMAGLVTGKPQLLKRNVDRATAARYREALQRAGIMVAFRQLPAADTAQPPSPPPVQPATTPASESAAPETPPSPAGLGLAPVGGDLLNPEERHHPQPVQVDISAYQLAPAGELERLLQAPPPPAPATDHFDLAPAGSDLLSDRTTPPLATVDAGDFSLAPAGALLETLPNSAEPVAPDTSHLGIAPAGSDLLDPDQRNRPTPPPPATDHLSLL
jgi:hypothetical protein